MAEVIKGILDLTTTTHLDFKECSLRGKYKNNESIKKIIFGPNIREIYPKTFMGCTGIRTITFPETLKDIDQNAFEGCTQLVSITFEFNGKEGEKKEYKPQISSCAFKGCVNLIEINIQGGLCWLVDLSSFEGLDLTKLQIYCRPEYMDHLETIFKNVKSINEVPSH